LGSLQRLFDARMSNTSDGQLIEAARSGSREAFESLLRPLIGPACQLAFGILSDWQEAEDAVQEAAYKAWKHVGGLRPGTSTLRPWFFAIVRNQCLSVRRGRWFSLVRSPEVRLAAAPAPDDEAARHVDLERALLGLTRSHRLVLLWHYYLDLPLEEVGPIMGISAGAAKSQLYRALTRLRPNLEVSEVTI
jgi:RNA polymerase sigma-70 factor (ECF subfamily)